MNYLDIANSGFMFILCAIPVCVILVQTILFIRLAWKPVSYTHLLRCDRGRDQTHRGKD